MRRNFLIKLKIEAEDEAKLRREIGFRIPDAEIISIRTCKMVGKRQTGGESPDSGDNTAM